jgi:hypothetical protein
MDSRIMNLITFILNRIDYYIQEISYLPCDIVERRKEKKRDRAFRKKYQAICKKAGIKS